MAPAVAPTSFESSTEPRRSSRVSSKPNSFASTTKPPSSKASDSTHQAKKNGTPSAKPKSSGSKKSEKSLLINKASPTKKTSSNKEVSASALSRSAGDTGKHSNSDEAANDEENGPSAPKKAKKEGKILDGGDGKVDHPTESSPKKTCVVGDKLLEGITLTTQDDKTVDILEAVKEKGAIIFIYPKANTPGCTNQACGFRDLHQEIVDAGYQVFGLSRDSPKTQKTWKEKQNLPYTLLCDPEQKLIKLLGASKSASTVQRSHYIIAPGGKIINVTNPASPKSGPQEALDFIKKS